MPGGEQEIKTTMTYQVNLDSTGMALGMGQMTQGIDSQMAAMVGRAGAGLMAGMREPIATALGMPPLGPEMTGPRGRMMLSQSLTAGWQNLETSAREYTNMGFYQNMLFGTKPEFGDAGLRNRLMMQQAFAAGPLLPGGPTSGEQMRAMAEQVSSPFNGMLGVQRPAGQMMASAMQSGLMNYTADAHQQMQAFQQMFALQGANRVFQVSPGEAGQLYTGILASGTSVGQASESYVAALRAQVAGVPLQTTLGAMGQSNQIAAMQQFMGTAGPNLSSAGAAANLTTAQLVFQQLQNSGFTVTDQQRASYNAGITQLSAFWGNTDRSRREAHDTMLRATFGQAGASVDLDAIAGADSMQKLMAHEQEAQSERISRGQLQIERLFSPKAILYDAMGMGATLLPKEQEDMVHRAMGYGTQASTGQISIAPGAQPGAVGGFSRGGFAAFQVYGAKAEMANRLAGVTQAHANADKLMQAGNSVGALTAMFNFANTMGGGAMDALSEQYSAFQKSNASMGGRLPSWAKMVGAMGEGSEAVSAALSVVQGADAAKFYGAVAPEFYGRVETDLKGRGADANYSQHALNEIYSGAGLKTGAKFDSANKAYLNAVFGISQGRLTGEQAAEGISDPALKKRISEVYKAYTGAEVDSDKRRQIGGPAAAQIAMAGRFQEFQEATSGAIGSQMKNIIGGIDGALQARIASEKSETAKGQFQHYKSELDSASKLTDNSAKAAKINDIMQEAAKGGATGRQVMSYVDSAMQKAQGGGALPQMASMPFADALIKAADALSALGTIARSLNAPGSGQKDK